jgi:hypothetical protein
MENLELGPLYKQWRWALYGRAKRFTRNDADAEDRVHDAFLMVMSDPGGTLAKFPFPKRLFVALWRKNGWERTTAKNKAEVLSRFPFPKPITQAFEPQTDELQELASQRRQEHSGHYQLTDAQWVTLIHDRARIISSDLAPWYKSKALHNWYRKHFPHKSVQAAGVTMTRKARQFREGKFACQSLNQPAPQSMPAV